MTTFDPRLTTVRGYQWEGDPRLVLTPNGATIEYRGGQPVMDSGLENAVLISLFTRKGWAGNIYIDDPDMQVGSDFEATAARSITRTMLNDLADAGKRALAWMKIKGIARQIDCVCSNPSGNYIKVLFTIYPPSGSAIALNLSRYSGLWTSQISRPAQERISVQ